jgi:integrase
MTYPTEHRFDPANQPTGELVPLRPYESPKQLELALERWLYDECGLSAKTIDVYLLQFRKVVALVDQAGLSLATISGGELRQLIDGSDIKASSSTRRQLRSVLVHYWEMIDRRRPPIKAIRVPRKPRMHCRALDEDKAALLAKAALKTWPEGAATLMGLYMALRRMEIAQARWDNFTEDFNWYTVHAGKGGVTATIPVHPVVRDRFMLRRPEPTVGFIFPGAGTRAREHVTEATIWNWVKATAKAAGIGDITVHQLRHTALAHMNDRTNDLRATMEFARHARPEITAGYTRTTRRQLEAAVGTLDYL